MSVYACENCGSVASTLAQWPGCGAVVGKANPPRVAPALTQRILPRLLGVFGFALTVPAWSKAVDAYSARVAENQIARDSLRRVESERQRAEKHRVRIARADSILNTIPRSRIAKLNNDQLNADTAIVAWRSDPIARKWINAATREMKARSKTKARGAGGSN
jgi:hypothetical protein